MGRENWTFFSGPVSGPVVASCLLLSGLESLEVFVRTLTLDALSLPFLFPGSSSSPGEGWLCINRGTAGGRKFPWA